MPYTTKPVTVDAVQWDGGSAAGVAQLTASAAVITEEPDGTLTVTAEGREDRTVHPGWWVSRAGDQVIVHSGEAFASLFEHA